MTDRPTLYAFWRGVATGIVASAFALFVLWFAVAFNIGMPQALDCVNYGDWTPAVDVEVTSNRKWGYFRTYQVGGCTAYFHASNKYEHFR